VRRLSRESSQDPASLLASPSTYLFALKGLRERHGLRADGFREPELSLAELPRDADSELAALLARAVSTEQYRFSPVIQRRAFLGGKIRFVHRPALSDSIVLMALARVLSAMIEPWLSERVYSYRKGRSSLLAVRDLARFVRRHRRERKQLFQRGLFVLRRDVQGYGDSIPVDAASPLWPMLKQALERAGCSHDHLLQRLLPAALCPLVEQDSGGYRRPARGVPMGTPLQPPICNLYLGPVDAALSAYSGGYYARYGDDLLFAHPELEAAREAAAALERELTWLGLALSPTKCFDIYWNGAGRAGPGGFRGTTHVEYLGCRLSFSANLGLGRRKLRCLHRGLERRVRASAALLAELPTATKLISLISVVNRALDPEHELALPEAAELSALVDDRQILAGLDRLIARVLAEVLSGRAGVRAFRSVPYRRLREAGLVSLEARRRRAAFKQRP
jgi:hypothetical protein